MSGTLFAQVCHDAGVPAGVFNLVNGTGPEVGARMSSHPRSTWCPSPARPGRARQIAAAAAATVKRVAQELGGKSPNIILPTADICRGGVAAGRRPPCCRNTGQSCDAPTRMLVHRSQQAEALAVAKECRRGGHGGRPARRGHRHGAAGLEDAVRQGAAADPGRHRRRRDAGHRRRRPSGRLNRGWFVRPTVFGDVTIR
jgi:aldehyde dehydrogenase (NAD+)